VPACGFALGFERLLLLMEEANLFPADLAALDLVLGTTSEEGGAAVLALGRELRGLGLRVSMLPKPEKAGKLRKAAEDQQARYAVWHDAGPEGGAARFQLWTREGDTSLRDLDAPAVLGTLKERAR
jgi:histidyl-tRNA synthetase